MERDENVVVFGQDVGYFGGVFRCTKGCRPSTASSRCFDAPITEGGIVGTAVGMAAYGLRPWSRSSSPTTSIRPTTRSSRRRRACATVRPATSPARSRSACHAAAASSAARRTARARRRCSPTSAACTVMPSNPYDAKGLLIASIENDDPVIFLEPKRLYNGPFDGHHDRPVAPWSKHPLGEVPEGHYTVPLGRPVFRRGQRCHRADLRHDGLRRGGGGRRDRHRRRDHRPAQLLAARPGDHRRLGEEDRPLRRSSTRPRAPAASAPSWWRWCRSIASITSKRRSSASPAGTRPTRMRRSGTTSPARSASARRSSQSMEA